MKFRMLAMALGGALAMSACRSDVSSPFASLADNDGVIDLMPDFEVSAASVLDGGGVGAAMLPDSLRLSADQKAQIQALHDAFRAATKADMDALRAIESEARAARKAGKTREEVRAIMAKGAPILDRLHAAFARLQASVLAVYTPAQRAWIAAHLPKVCGPAGPPVLTDAQVAAIRTLRQAFAESSKADMELIRAVHLEARAAHAAGKTKAEVDAILAKAKGAMERVRAAERKLMDDVKNLLTTDQLAKWCVVRPLGPRP
jgi:hypothetical protein